MTTHTHTQSESLYFNDFTDSLYTGILTQGWWKKEGKECKEKRAVTSQHSSLGVKQPPLISVLLAELKQAK